MYDTYSTRNKKHKHTKNVIKKSIKRSMKYKGK